jgi:hypothetical protein
MLTFFSEVTPHVTVQIDAPGYIFPRGGDQLKVRPNCRLTRPSQEQLKALLGVQGPGERNRSMRIRWPLWSQGRFGEARRRPYDMSERQDP